MIGGRRPVEEALRRLGIVRELLVAGDDHARGPVKSLIDKANERGVPVTLVDPVTLDRITDGQHHQGVAAICALPASCDLEELLGQASTRGAKALVVLADHLQDPHNLGALMRSALAAGAHGIIIPEDRAVAMTPAVVRASSGAALLLPYTVVVNLARTVRLLKRAGLWVVGLHLQGESDLYGLDLTEPTCIAIGSEGAGLSRGVRDECDVLAHIPLNGAVEALNASVAGAVALFEARRQRRSE
ncbi:MAG: 23S rRNA (guanosine(2251)-2'-O)-methyltransferase RlmB [Chloroflexi bacterium]|nr:23S rRNA (guanosine(2251)-2'-O)-methyltransferase RlmB [Chloroflexota bacterium]